MKTRWWIALLAIVLLTIGGLLTRQGLLRSADRGRIAAELRSEDAETRKQAAWATIDLPSPAFEAAMIQGLLGSEPEPSVREAFAYALGRSQCRPAMAALEQVLDTDSSGLVRAAAWLAVARIDPEHCRTLLATATPGDDPWNQLAQAQAAVACGNAAPLTTLLDFAERGTHDQRVTAGHALDRELVAILDALGQWPADAPRRRADGDWSEELIAHARPLMRSDRLQAIQDQLRAEFDKVEACRAQLARLDSARNSLAAWLFR